MILTIEVRDLVAFDLHDCYADFWLPHYERLLEKLLPLGRLCTLDQVSAETLLAHTRFDRGRNDEPRA